MNQKEIEQHLFQLLSVADAQQRAAIEAVSGLIKERQELAKERTELKSTIDIGIQNAVLRYGTPKLEGIKASHHFAWIVLISVLVAIWTQVMFRWAAPVEVAGNFDQEALIQRLRQEQLLHTQEPITPTKIKNKR